MDTQTLLIATCIITIATLLFLYQNHLLRREREKNQTKREQEIDVKLSEILKEIKAAQLSPREEEILLLKADKTNKEIADRLCRSIETIKKITDKLHKKFNVHRDIDLIKYALALQQKEDKG